MSNYNNLKTSIDANIKQNGNQEITGPILNSVLNQMVNILGTGYQFAGVATLDPATDPGTPDAKVFYIANGKGKYTNFGGLEVTEDEVVVLYWDSAWHKVATGIASQAKLSELEGKVNPLKSQVDSNTQAIEGIAASGGASVASAVIFSNGENAESRLGDRSANETQMGYVVLRKGVLFKEQVTEKNTIYEIRYDFDLYGEDVQIPQNCVLKFNGGSVGNGSIIFDDTLLVGKYKFNDLQSISGDVLNDTIDSSRIGFINDTYALYSLLHLGGMSKLILENKEYNIDSRIINDSSFGAFVHMQRNNLEIVGNGATIIDARGNSELLQAKSYFYFLTFLNSDNIRISQLGYISNDSTIEILVGSEMETFGLCFVSFTNCSKIDLTRLYGKNISVGITINETIEGQESSPSVVNGSFDNVGYMIMLNGAENIDISMNAKTISHRCIYFGGARNINVKVSLDSDISVTASGFLFQEFWKTIGQDNVFQQCSNIKLKIDAFGSITGNSLIKLLRYDSSIHPIIGEKDTSYVMDGMDIQVNLYKGASVSTIFDSSLNKVYDHNILFRGRIVCNYFEDTNENDYPIFIACGSGSTYNNIDFDLDVYIYSQNQRNKKLRLTNLTKSSSVRINTNAPIAISAISGIGNTKGVGQLILDGDSFSLSDRAEDNTCCVLVNKGVVDKSVYRSVVGFKEVKTTFKDFVSATTATYESLLKQSTDINLDIQESFTFNAGYDRIKNYFAKNEEHLLLVKNTSSSDVTFGLGLFDIKKGEGSYTMPSNSTLMFRFGTINGLSFISRVTR